MPATTYNYVSPGVIEVTDANGDTTRLEFTSTGQIAEITDPLSRVAQFAYDANDYLSQLTAPGNTVYGYSYDAEGRLLSQTDPLGQTVSFSYGANSEAPETVTDQRGNVTTYSYDTSGNLTGLGYEWGSGESFTRISHERKGIGVTNRRECNNHKTFNGLKRWPRPKQSVTCRATSLVG